ncbi:MAG: penicillin-binding protein 1C [Bdellovibrionales bacterium]|nr:penicillin-binding protein 1C [Bdellovibrionales bacterium]
MKRFLFRRFFVSRSSWVIPVSLLLLIMGSLYLIRKFELLSPLRSVTFSQEVLASKGELLRVTLTADEKYRIFQPLSEIPIQMQEAVLLLEDQWFYHHPGVNPVSLFRAALSLGSERPIGASTITMQLVRLKENLYTRSFIGKAKQVFWSFLYELLYSKKQILEAYLNLVPYGSNIEGVGAASLVYFKKNPKTLALAEVLTLAVIPQNPIKRSLNKPDLTKTTLAKSLLAKRWLVLHPEDQQVSIELNLPILAKSTKSLPFEAPHFVNQVLRKTPAVHKIHTTLDFRTQKRFESVLKKYVGTKSSYGVSNAAALLVENQTGLTKAWIGSGDFFSKEIEGQNDAITARRSPGSLLKPFLYGLAIDEGLLHPQSLLKDTPSYFGSYDPENFDRNHKGPLSATEALIQSRNVPAVWVASQLKRKSLYNLLREAQVELLQNERYYGLAIALGIAEMTMEDLARLYTMLARQGRLLPDPAPTQVLSPEAAYLVLQMLTENPRAENLLLDQTLKNQLSIAWKTGTSHGYRDAWTVGIVGPYTLVVWLGNFDNTSNPKLIGREIAAPLFFKLLDSLPQTELAQPTAWSNSFGLNLKKVQVCSISGSIPNEFCPHRKPVDFIPGVSPISECDLHRQVVISKKTGLRPCHSESTTHTFDKTDRSNGGVTTDVYEFWSSDIVEFFSKVGLQRKLPPAFEEGCSAVEIQNENRGKSPLIVSPKTETDYVISYQRSGFQDRFPLKAIADASVRQLTWFINQRIVGQSAPEETLMTHLGPGNFEVMVVDDQGRSAQREMRVKVVE